MRVGFRRLYSNLNGLNNAPMILGKHLKGSLEGIGKRLVVAGRSRMRKSSGEAQRSLTSVVTGRGLNYTLDVYSTLIQAFIDAYGLRPGTFPSFGRGSRIYRWAERVSKTKYKRREVETGEFRKRKVGRPKKQNRFSVRKPRKVAKVGNKPIPRTGRNKMRDASVRRFAYMAARSIFTNGIKPTYWNEKALNVNRGRIELDLRNGIRRAVNEINRR